jgi:lipoprotein-anchoring transpeptidase ErfK/SrfK
MVTLRQGRYQARFLLGIALFIGLLCITRTASAASPGAPPMMHQGHWVLVNLAQQHLYAYDGATLVRDTAVSTGIPGHETPVGSFTIQQRFLSQEMKGPGYDLPNVPYVQYFGNDGLSWGEGYSLHGTYWHHNFGHVMSHGCVNLPTDFASWLWNWAGIGSPVEIVSG